MKKQTKKPKKLKNKHKNFDSFITNVKKDLELNCEAFVFMAMDKNKSEVVCSVFGGKENIIELFNAIVVAVQKEIAKELE